MYAEDEYDSIHLCSWPVMNETFIDEESEQRGDLIIAVIRDIRKEKNRQGIPLNMMIEKLTINTEDQAYAGTLEIGSVEILKTVKAEEINIIKEKGGKFEVEGYPKVRFSFPIGTGDN
jgi:valyl-tRNA synthetase